MTKILKLGDKSVSLLSKCATKLAGPENRLILGVSALASQPFIDYFNKNVDEKTRKYSVCKTISKIIVGTTVGVIVRALAIKYSGKFINKIDIKKLLPNTTNPPVNKELLQKSIGDILALGVCLITNFLIDAPLTKKSTNMLVKKFVKDDK